VPESYASRSRCAVERLAELKKGDPSQYSGMMLLRFRPEASNGYSPRRG
jgi:hypothetical protein